MRLPVRASTALTELCLLARTVTSVPPFPSLLTAKSIAFGGTPDQEQALLINAVNFNVSKPGARLIWARIKQERVNVAFCVYAHGLSLDSGEINSGTCQLG